MDRRRARDRLHHVLGRGREQVRETDLQAAAGVDAQHQRPRALVGSQHHLARLQIRRRRVGGHHVGAQRVDLAVGTGRTQTIHLESMIQRDHVGVYGAVAVPACRGIGGVQ